MSDKKQLNVKVSLEHHDLVKQEAVKRNVSMSDLMTQLIEQVLKFENDEVEANLVSFKNEENSSRSTLSSSHCNPVTLAPGTQNFSSVDRFAGEVAVLSQRLTLQEQTALLLSRQIATIQENLLKNSVASVEQKMTQQIENRLRQLEMRMEQFLQVMEFFISASGSSVFASTVQSNKQQLTTPSSPNSASTTPSSLSCPVSVSVDIQGADDEGWLTLNEALIIAQQAGYKKSRPSFRRISCSANAAEQYAQWGLVFDPSRRRGRGNVSRCFRVLQPQQQSEPEIQSSQHQIGSNLACPKCNSQLLGRDGTK